MEVFVWLPVKGTATDIQNGVLKSFVHVIKYANFQLYEA